MKPGKVKYVVVDFPLPFHRNALKAHQAANCANDQGKYWEMHDRLFGNQRTLGEKELSGHAKAVGLDVAAFEECLQSGEHAPEIQKDIAEGRKAGVRGTPSFGLGYTEPESSEVMIVQLIRGAQPYSTFKRAIDALLKAEKK